MKALLLPAITEWVAIPPSSLLAETHQNGRDWVTLVDEQVGLVTVELGDVFAIVKRAGPWLADGHEAIGFATVTQLVYIENETASPSEHDLIEINAYGAATYWGDGVTLDLPNAQPGGIAIRLRDCTDTITAPFFDGESPRPVSPPSVPFPVFVKGDGLLVEATR